jgi:ubiquinone/menaquinone biosynthesis C-methylase UbiE
MPFADQFTRQASAYAQFRPTYPEALFAALAERAPGRRRAWDCATGSGQAALGLARYFAHVAATDGSAGQLAAAVHHPRVGYAVALAEACPLADRCVDVVTVAQALHWLDRPVFFAEARRVLVPGGVLAFWCYTLAEVTAEVDRALARFYRDTVGPYFLPGRELVDEGYRSIEMPFEELAIAGFAIEREMGLVDYLGYLNTWSAVQRYLRVTGGDPIAPLAEELRPLWGDPETRRMVRWPLAARAGRRT